ncbi:hypothetical protein MmiEs2_11370 [Methanimicrococcus stummii]|uniref:DUF4391 domain-containing protein n=1 Tax=Methanimicrococcus stummii TaxID=3028294 RepID=A0AA96ZXG1_9EURY|nr:DUF4391 domain-containing protein [Methanimicrococcus sp. Es2]WNY28924.1 hypothetical protein MmiEs2_11370 [Methanimicrococcus sp. Es2]
MLLNLPETTIYGKKVPKQNFYENPSMTPALKRLFIDQVHSIVWQNKISPFTVNVGTGTYVSEIEIIHIQLNSYDLDKKVLQFIDKTIPYHILFLLEYRNEIQARISFKEESQKAGTFKIGTYYQTDWLSPSQFDLRLEGLSMDSVYENFVYQIAGDRLNFDTDAGKTEPETLKDAVILDGKRQKILNEIAALNNKIDKEKQFNRQTELFSQVKLKRKELEEL